MLLVYLRIYFYSSLSRLGLSHYLLASHLNSSLNTPLLQLKCIIIEYIYIKLFIKFVPFFSLNMYNKNYFMYTSM